MNKDLRNIIISIVLSIICAALICLGVLVCIHLEDANLEPNTNLINVESTLENNNTGTLDITIYQKDIELIAKTVYGEARGCSVAEQSAVIWCILNRVDAGYGTIEEVITAPYQFTGYKETNPVQGDFVELATDVLLRWQIEKYCIGDVGRTLPDNYLYFHGDGKQNHFRDKYDGNYNTWEWQALNPYP